MVRLVGVASFILLTACQPPSQTELASPDTGIANTAPAVDEVAPRKVSKEPLKLSQAPPFAAKPQDGTPCVDIYGYLDDPDPAGRNVRDTPSTSGGLLGVIPAQGKLDFPASFQILESRSGWLKIKGAGFDPELVGNRIPPSYSGEGWISGKGVRVTLQTRLGFAAPSHDAPWLVDGRPGEYFDSMKQSAIVGCSGNWVLVDWPYDPKPPFGGKPLTYRELAVVSRNPITLRAWSTGICNIQETSCDGVDGDRPPPPGVVP